MALAHAAAVAQAFAGHSLAEFEHALGSIDATELRVECAEVERVAAAFFEARTSRGRTFLAIFLAPYCAHDVLWAALAALPPVHWPKKHVALLWQLANAGTDRATQWRAQYTAFLRRPVDEPVPPLQPPPPAFFPTTNQARLAALELIAAARALLSDPAQSLPLARREWLHTRFPSDPVFQTVHRLAFRATLSHAELLGTVVLPMLDALAAGPTSMAALPALGAFWWTWLRADAAVPTFLFLLRDAALALTQATQLVAFDVLRRLAKPRTIVLGVYAGLAGAVQRAAAARIPPSVVSPLAAAAQAGRPLDASDVDGLATAAPLVQVDDVTRAYVQSGAYLPAELDLAVATRILTLVAAAVPTGDAALQRAIADAFVARAAEWLRRAPEQARDTWLRSFDSAAFVAASPAALQDSDWAVVVAAYAALRSVAEPLLRQVVAAQWRTAPSPGRRAVEDALGWPAPASWAELPNRLACDWQLPPVLGLPPLGVYLYYWLLPPADASQHGGARALLRGTPLPLHDQPAHVLELLETPALQRAVMAWQQTLRPERASAQQLVTLDRGAFAQVRDRRLRPRLTMDDTWRAVVTSAPTAAGDASLAQNPAAAAVAIAHMVRWLLAGHELYYAYWLRAFATTDGFGAWTRLPVPRYAEKMAAALVRELDTPPALADRLRGIIDGEELSLED